MQTQLIVIGAYVSVPLLSLVTFLAFLLTFWFVFGETDWLCGNLNLIVYNRRETTAFLPLFFLGCISCVVVRLIHHFIEALLDARVTQFGVSVNDI